MILKKIELFGFKSFKNKTIIGLDKGITGIVGPNGCGKSNIVDAFLWVMGETSPKNLRGSSMEDVIFSGSADYKPTAFAQVSLFLENDGGVFPFKYLDQSEIMITRRLNRNGDSQYLINQKQVRLKDVQEVFMDTGIGARGFSIIEQGAIEQMVSAKPEDRRQMVEEAAGIIKFKSRKRESLRKLENTHQHLLRLNDILSEQNKQLSHLEKQAEKANEYQSFQDELEDKDLWILTQDYLNLKENFEKNEQIFSSSKEKKESLERQKVDEQNLIEVYKNDLFEMEQNLKTKQEKFYQLKENLIREESEKKHLNLQLEDQKSRHSEMTSFFEGAKEEKKNLEEKIKEKSLQYEKISQEFKELETKKIDSSKDFDEKKKDLEEKLTQSSELKKRLFSLEKSFHIQATQISSSEFKVKHLEDLIKKNKKEESSLIHKKKEFEKNNQELFSKDQSLKNEEKNLNAKIEECEKRLQENEKHLMELKEKEKREKEKLFDTKSMIEVLENMSLLSDHEKKVKEVLKDKFQSFTDYLEIEKQAQKAFQAAFYPFLNMLFSSKLEDTLEALEALKDKGSSYFYLNHLSKENLSQPESSEIKYCLKDKVSVQKDSLQPVLKILEKVYVCKDVKTCLNLYEKYPDLIFATESGEALFHGILLGGQFKESFKVNRLQKIKDLKDKKLVLEKEYQNIKELCEKKEQDETDLKEKIKSLEIKENENRVLLNQLKEKIDFFNTQIKQEEKKTDLIQKEISSLNEDIQKEMAHQKTLSDSQKNFHQEKKQIELQLEKINLKDNSFEQNIKDLNEKSFKDQSLYLSKKSELELMKLEKDSLESRLEDLNLRISQMKKESLVDPDEKKKQTESLEKSIKEMSDQVLEEERKLNLLKDESEEKRLEVLELDKKILGKHQSFKQMDESIHDSELKCEKIKVQMDHLKDQLSDKYSKTFEAIIPEYGSKSGEKEEFKQRIASLKRKIERIGPVNLVAKEEYDSLKEKYEFLNKQYEDLNNSKKQLEQVIQKINQFCKKRFEEVFNEINTQFEKVFPILFGGGSAKLILVDNEKMPEEKGIDIEVHPPGKKTTRLSLLSGGEKALTSVSLIFAISLVKPSPFCLLDEVDAPLDDINIVKFNELIEHMSQKSQIIIVTHNKYTMRMNHRLFGVTQEEKGISKIVSVSLDEGEKILELS